VLNVQVFCVEGPALSGCCTSGEWGATTYWIAGSVMPNFMSGLEQGTNQIKYAKSRKTDCQGDGEEPFGYNEGDTDILGVIDAIEARLGEPLRWKPEIHLSANANGKFTTFWFQCDLSADNPFPKINYQPYAPQPGGPPGFPPLPPVAPSPPVAPPPPRE
jgi:hypothetical protein